MYNYCKNVTNDIIPACYIYMGYLTSGHIISVISKQVTSFLNKTMSYSGGFLLELTNKIGYNLYYMIIH